MECPIRFHGVLAVFQPKPRGVGFHIKLLIWVTIVLSAHLMKEMRLPWVSPRIGNLEDKNKGQKMCGGATRKRDVSRVTRNKLEITFFNFVGWPQLSDICGPVASATKLNYKGPSSSPRRVEYTPANLYDIVNL